MTRTLGAILAGGRSSRFGSDKALALLDGQTLIDHVAARLRPQCTGLLICGRTVPGETCVADRPGSDLGPLGGLNAALHHAAANGFDAVVSVPCDTPLLPDDLVERLAAAGGGYMRDLPVIGWWPATLAASLDAHLAHGGDRSVRRWAESAGLGPVDLPPLANVNTPDDLARLGHTDPTPRSG